MFTILFALLITLSSTTSVPSLTTKAPTLSAPTTAAAGGYNCYCHSIPLKDWGK